MSLVNVMAREISAKVVFYGPGLSGKTTSLRRIYESIKPSLRGDLMSLPTEADRTLFFDFLPVRVEKLGDYSLRLALYTVPGQVFYNATRKLVLQGADGVVFVADSNPGAAESNDESLANLEENLQEQGIALSNFPLVIQYNKRDLPSAVPLAEMRARYNPRGLPDFETCATSGEGVLDVMKASVRLVMRELRARKIVPAPRKAPEPMALDAQSGLEAQIQEHLQDELQKQTSPRVTLGPAAALAPQALIDVARVAETCFQKHDFDGCVRSSREAVHRALAFAGEGPLGSQAVLLGLDGRDVLRLETLSAQPAARVDQAAFALSVMMQAFIRLSDAGLPVSTEA